MYTRDQQFAQAVYEKVDEVLKAYPEAEQKKYGSMAHKLPILIRKAGLVQALVFVRARDEPMHQLLLQNLAEVTKTGTRDELLADSRNLPLHQYIFLTQQVLTALLWFKRFAQSVLGVEAADDGDETTTAVAKDGDHAITA